MLSESTTRQALADQLAGRCEGGTPLRTARPCGPREEEPSVAHIAYPPSKVLNHDGTAWTLIDLSVVPPSAMESQRPNWTASPCALANRPLVHSHARDPLCGPASFILTPNPSSPCHSLHQDKGELKRQLDRSNTPRASATTSQSPSNTSNRAGSQASAARATGRLERWQLKYRVSCAES
jgi:hypothetical protein